METFMSRGPGKIERIIRAVFAAEPDNAFTTEDLCDRAYPGVNRIEKKHRVAVLRAAQQLEARGDAIWCIKGDGLGGTLIFFNPYHLPSYAMARLKTTSWYRTHDTRRSRYEPWDETRLRAKLAPGGDDRKHIDEGGVWWRHVEIHKAVRDGDTERAEALRHEQSAIRAALAAYWGGTVRP